MSRKIKSQYEFPSNLVGIIAVWHVVIYADALEELYSVENTDILIHV